jgi:hypothetical protein
VDNTVPGSLDKKGEEGGIILLAKVSLFFRTFCLSIPASEQGQPYAEKKRE